MARARTEFELKLAGPARDVLNVAARDWLATSAVGAGGWERLVSTYYDSADRRLAAAGLSLRIRDEACAKIISGKISAAGAAPVARLEAERRLTPGDPPWRTGDGEIDALIGDDASDLAPIARVSTDRWRSIVAAAGGVVELSAEIGLGERLAPDRAAAPLAEVELEHVKGDQSAVFALARRLIDESDGRLRLSVRTKLDRALAAGALEPLGKPPRLVLSDDQSAGDALAATLRQLARRIIECADLAAATHDAAAAQQLRVALRRFRALERAFRPALESDELRRLARRARDFARLVGAARDFDVFAEKSLALVAEPVLHERFDALRAQQWAQTGETLLSASFGDFTLALLEAAHLEGWRLAPSARLERPARDFADDLLGERRKALVEKARLADFAVPETLHPLRLELKKLRYAAQFFRDLYPEAARKPFFAAMSALQDSFGAISDAVAAATIAERAADGAGPAAARAAGFIAGWQSAVAAAAAEAIEAEWRAFAATPPYWDGAD